MTGIPNYIKPKTLGMLANLILNQVVRKSPEVLLTLTIDTARKPRRRMSM